MFRRHGMCVLAALAPALALLLAGCDVRGSAEVRSADEVFVDLTFTDLPRGRCWALGHSDAGVTTVQHSVRGVSTCRVRGSFRPSSVIFVDLASVADYYVLSVDLTATAGSVGNADVFVSMPGTVGASSHGVVDGAHIRLSGEDVAFAGSYLRVVAQADNGSGWTPMALGLLAVAALGLVAAFRRRAAESRPFPADGTASPSDTATTAHHATLVSVRAPIGSVDHSVWAEPDE